MKAGPSQTSTTSRAALGLTKNLLHWSQEGTRLSCLEPAASFISLCASWPTSFFLQSNRICNNNTITDGGSTAPLYCWYHTEEKPSARMSLHCFLLKLGNNYHRLQQTATNCHILLKRADEELIKSWWRTDEELMKNWWRTDEELMKNWWRTDEELMKSWWRTEVELMKNW